MPTRLAKKKKKKSNAAVHREEDQISSEYFYVIGGEASLTAKLHHQGSLLDVVFEGMIIVRRRRMAGISISIFSRSRIL